MQASPVYTMRTDLYPHSITRAEYYQQMALGYSENGQIEKSIENYKLSLLHNPYSVSAHVGLADVYIHSNNYLLALIELYDAQRIEPQNLDVMKKTGDLYLTAEIYSKARETYYEMLKVNNKDEEAQWAIFYIYKLEKKYEDALVTLAKIPAGADNNYKITHEKAVIYKLKNELEKYDELITKAQELNPRDRAILMEYVSANYAKKDFEAAAKALLQYSNTQNFDLAVSQNLAFAAVQTENYKVAIREYDKQRAFALKNEDLLKIDLKRAHCYFLMGDPDTSEKIYLALALRYQSDEARFYLAQIYISKDKKEDAAFVLSQIESSSDFFADAQVKLALYKKFYGDDDQALNVLHSAFLARPDTLEIYRAYADFLIADKKYVETVALLEKAIQLFPKDEEIRLKMAYLHFRLNNSKSFKKQIMAALKINPESADAYAMLSELWYLKNKNVDETIYFVKRAAELKSTNKNIKPILAWALMQKNRSTEAVALFEEFYEENPDESFFARSLSQVYSRGGVKNKSKKLADIAAKLEMNDSLKSRFIFRDETQPLEAGEFNENKTRLPASLEN